MSSIEPIYDWVKCPSCGHQMIAVGGGKTRTRCLLCAEGVICAEPEPIRDADGNVIPTDPLPSEFGEPSEN